MANPLGKGLGAPSFGKRATAGTTFGQRVRALRLDRKLTQEELGQQIGMSGRRVHEIEAGRSTPKPENLRALEDFFETPLPSPAPTAPTGAGAERRAEKIRRLRHLAGRQLILLRSERGLSREALGEMVGESKWRMGMIEDGKVELGLDLLGALAEALSTIPLESTGRRVRVTPAMIVGQQPEVRPAASSPPAASPVVTTKRASNTG